MSHRRPVEIKGPGRGNWKGETTHTHSTNLPSISNTFWHLKPTQQEKHSFGLCILQIRLHQSWPRVLGRSSPHSIALNKVNTIIFMCKMWQMAAGNFLTAAATRVAFFRFPFFRSAVGSFATKYATQKCPLITHRQNTNTKTTKPKKTNQFCFFLHLFVCFGVEYFSFFCATSPVNEMRNTTRENI